MSTPRELVDEAYGFLYGSDADEAIKLIEAAVDALEADLGAARDALREIVQREARSEYSSLNAAPGEFAEIARAALAEAAP